MKLGMRERERESVAGDLVGQWLHDFNMGDRNQWRGPITNP